LEFGIVALITKTLSSTKLIQVVWWWRKNYWKPSRHMHTYQTSMTFSDTGFDKPLRIEFQIFIELKSIISVRIRQLWSSFDNNFHVAQVIFCLNHIGALILLWHLGQFYKLCGALVPQSKVTIRQWLFTIWIFSFDTHVASTAPISSPSEKYQNAIYLHRKTMKVCRV